MINFIVKFISTKFLTVGWKLSKANPSARAIFGKILTLTPIAYLLKQVKLIGYIYSIINFIKFITRYFNYFLGLSFIIYVFENYDFQYGSILAVLPLIDFNSYYQIIYNILKKAMDRVLLEFYNPRIVEPVISEPVSSDVSHPKKDLSPINDDPNPNKVYYILTGVFLFSMTLLFSEEIKTMVLPIVASSIVAAWNGFIDSFFSGGGNGNDDPATGQVPLPEQDITLKDIRFQPTPSPLPTPIETTKEWADSQPQPLVNRKVDVEGKIVNVWERPTISPTGSDSSSSSGSSIFSGSPLFDEATPKASQADLFAPSITIVSPDVSPDATPSVSNRNLPPISTGSTPYKLPGLYAPWEGSPSAPSTPTPSPTPSSDDVKSWWKGKGK